MRYDMNVCACQACRTVRADVGRIVREQTVRDADSEDVGLAAIHVCYTETQS